MAEREKNHQILLMNRNKKTALFDEQMIFGVPTYSLNRQYDSYLPYGFFSMDAWLENRPAAKHRKHIRELMKQCGCDTIRGYIDVMHATSLNDTFWVKDAESDLTWEDVSLYSNEFDDVVARVAFDGNGLYGIQFSPTRLSPELETSGNYPKCWIRENDEIYLMKAGIEGFANAGGEPYSEKLVSDLLDALGYTHVSYTLERFHGKLATRCKSFCTEEKGFIPVSSYMAEKGYSGSLTDIIKSVEENGCESDFYHMLAIDAICVNTDRHVGNFGFLVNNENGEIKGFAPLFDHNLALLPGMMKDDDWKKTIKEDCDTAFGTDFIMTAEEAIRRYPDIRADLIALKDFEFQNPGYDCPEWRIKTVNDIKDYQIRRLLSL